MCGRLNVIDNPVMAIVLDILGINFMTVTNKDLRPTQKVATLAFINGEIQQLNLAWGIKPNWSKKLLINAQGETVAEKRTFKKAFATKRCIVPCSGWYEWRSKQKYLFEQSDGAPVFMAGIWFEEESSNKLVTLTIKPNQFCAQYHSRMPLLIDPSQINSWLTDGEKDIHSFITTPANDSVRVIAP